MKTKCLQALLETAVTWFSYSYAYFCTMYFEETLVWLKLNNIFFCPRQTQTLLLNCQSHVFVSFLTLQLLHMGKQIVGGGMGRW